MGTCPQIANPETKTFIFCDNVAKTKMPLPWWQLQNDRKVNKPLSRSCVINFSLNNWSQNTCIFQQKRKAIEPYFVAKYVSITDMCSKLESSMSFLFSGVILGTPNVNFAEKSCSGIVFKDWTSWILNFDRSLPNVCVPNSKQIRFQSKNLGIE